MKPIAAGLTCALLASPAAACDVALVLALDVSGSVDPTEYRLQAAGLSAALGDAIVSEALVNAKAIVAVVQWSGEPHQELSVPWTAIDSHDDVLVLRSRVDAASRAFINYSTGIGEALRFSTNLFADAPRPCDRRVIDVSGDGPSNEGLRPEAMRALFDDVGIIVNGLAIEGSEENIVSYYRTHVIHGGGAFVEVAKDFKDFPRAMRRKLLRELADKLVELQEDESPEKSFQ